MFFIQRREPSERADAFGLMNPFFTVFRGKALPVEIKDNLHDKRKLERTIAKHFGDGYYLIFEIGGRACIRIHFNGECSAFF
jgi:hypothetical protein